MPILRPRLILRLLFVSALMVGLPLQAAEPVERLIIRYKQPLAAHARASSAAMDERARAASQVEHSADVARAPQVSYLKSVSPQLHVARLSRALPADEAQALIERLQADPTVASVTIDQRVRPHALPLPTDPFFSTASSGYYQWHLQAPSVEPGGINAAAAWASSTGANVTVAVLDGGYRPHPDLVANLLTASDYDFISDLWTANDGDLRDADAQARIAAAAADAMVVAAYGLILPAEVLRTPRLGCINIHASLLPRWRGAAPIQRAIEAGDTETGITIMQMDEGLDTGPMLLARAIPIVPEETGGSLHDRLAELGARLVVEAMDALARGDLEAVPQPAEGVTYAAKIDKAETEVDWRLPAVRLADRIRAFDPFPGSVVRLPDAGGALKLWRAAPLPGSAAPGTVLQAEAGRLVVACGEGALSLLELQKPGGRRLPVADFLRGFPLAAGARLPLRDGV